MVWIVYGLGCGLLITIAAFDWCYRLIPRRLSLPLLGLGLLANPGVTAWTQLKVGLITMGALTVARSTLNRLIKQEAFGFGDVILVAISTVWLGWEIGLLGAYCACCFASVYGLYKRYRSGTKGFRIPMAPFFILGWGISWVGYPYLKPLFLSHY